MSTKTEQSKNVRTEHQESAKVDRAKVQLAVRTALKAGLLTTAFPPAPLPTCGDYNV